MRKTRWILVSLIVFIVSISAPGDTKFLGWDLSMRRIYLSDDQGVWGSIQYQHFSGQSLYGEFFQIGDFYQQGGAGFGITIYKNQQVHVSSTFGIDKYRIFDFVNSFYRTGLCLDWELGKGSLTLDGDLVLDDQVGNFLRYQLNYSLPVQAVKLDLGVGNLLGSKDGLAFWIGIGL